jgi:hypothetical protein
MDRIMPQRPTPIPKHAPHSFSLEDAATNMLRIG